MSTPLSNVCQQKCRLWECHRGILEGNSEPSLSMTICLLSESQSIKHLPANMQILNDTRVFCKQILSLSFQWLDWQHRCGVRSSKTPNRVCRSQAAAVVCLSWKPSPSPQKGITLTPFSWTRIYFCSGWFCLCCWYDVKKSITKFTIFLTLSSLFPIWHYFPLFLCSYMHNSPFIPGFS